MMRDLGRRLEVVEERLGSLEDEGPGPVVFHIFERSFESTDALHRWRREREAAQRKRRFESPTAIRLTVVRRCVPGEQPTECAIRTVPVYPAPPTRGFGMT
jgi:hypothetical protein